ncbi:DUF488 domain-containing protein [Halomonas sp. DN3]|uniref:DUF488 domain-containing protein n=1 Tax=Halomonas sp. DN3 TaxID=2953657 RepID=UPI00209CAFFE|nr:DUF488 family protein [Halomonas sp. DN3]USZ48283.1 DUF488 family protein [Halomonas sp. DN3]
MSYDIVFKGVYQAPEPDDGARVLVDRLWPRGRSRESLALAEWYREASPSNALRRQYQLEEISSRVFEIRYRGELRDHPDRLYPLMRLARCGRLTLVTAARDIDSTHLPELRQRLLEALHQEDQEDALPSSPPCFAHESGQH